MERERRVQKSMGKRISELLCSTNRSDQSSSYTLSQVQSSGDICNSRMELLDLVATTIKDFKTKKKYHKKDAFNKAIIGVVGQIRKHKVSNCPSGWKSFVQIRDLGMILSVGENTFKNYTRIYNAFIWFVTAFNINANDPYALEYYGAYLAINAQTSRVISIRPAVQFWANIERRTLPISWSYDKVKKGLLLIHTLVNKRTLKRDVIQFSSIEKFMSQDRFFPF